MVKKLGILSLALVITFIVFSTYKQVKAYTFAGGKWSIYDLVDLSISFGANH